MTYCVQEFFALTSCANPRTLGHSMENFRVGVLDHKACAEACHVLGLQSHPDADVLGLCGRNPAGTRAMADRLGNLGISVDCELVHARKGIDAIAIATPNVAHAKQTKAATAAGKLGRCRISPAGSHKVYSRADRGGDWRYPLGADDGVRYDSQFKVAAFHVVVEVAVEIVLRYCFQLNQHRLPFGCHAWPR